MNIKNPTSQKKASFSLKHVAFKYYSKPLYFIFFLLGLDPNKNTLDTFLSLALKNFRMASSFIRTAKWKPVRTWFLSFKNKAAYRK